jgi:lipopolysaccharide transport system ATP-binding protein
VGRNGAGKSTLLQIICGTLTPTSGTVVVNGRVAALLELGAGFNPEFTGRENVYMNAAILGLKKDEINERFDDIAAFADIGVFLDQPVKTYSSGMYMRLAFAIAINTNPDILIVDEALSVGDEAFQRRCFSRLLQIRNEGVTIFFVSHSAALVIELCDRAILIDRGELLLSGRPKMVVSMYHKLMYANEDRAAILRQEIKDGNSRQNIRDEASAGAQQVNSRGEEAERLGDCFDPSLVSKSAVKFERQGGEIIDPHIETQDGERVNVLSRGQQYEYVYKIKFSDEAYEVRWGTMIKTITGLEIGGVMSHPIGNGLQYVESGQVISARLRFSCSLLPGTYFMNAGVVGIVNGAELFLDRIMDAFMFRVQPEANLEVVGIVDFSAAPQHRHVDLIETEH